MIISLELPEEDAALFRKYADLHNMSLSDFIRNIVFERIGDEHDLKVYREALGEFKKDPTTYTVEEMKERFKIK